MKLKKTIRSDSVENFEKSNYVICLIRKNQPKVHVKVCSVCLEDCKVKKAISSTYRKAKNYGGITDESN